MEGYQVLLLGREVELDNLPYSSLINILHAEAAASFEDLTLSNKDDTLAWQANEAWPNSFRKARFLSAVDHVQLDRLRYLVMKAMDDLFKDIDILIGPFDIGPMLVASNFSGHPCLHLRVGFESLRTRARIKSEKIDLKKKFMVPRGLSIWGALFEEDKILNFGLALEAKLNIADQRPTFAT
jgi:Asp-tRNA(Asn)/Glu-tRNA(Gln) amidotransferase A subunit family amidase